TRFNYNVRTRVPDLHSRQSKMRIITALLLCLIAALQVSQCVSQKYGSACGVEGKCDSRSGMITCSTHNVCTCPDSESMIYNSEEDTCVGRIGTVCYTRSLTTPSLMRTCVVGTECIPITRYSVFGICEKVSASR
ncbi:unnamed protein product, partial [Allacma fusca]